MANELVTWSDDFLVGNSAIDTQHRELVNMTNDFYAGVKVGGLVAKVYFLQTIKGAVNYIKNHFQDEEALMRKVEYPDYEEHKKQHEHFVNKVTQQIKNFEIEDNPDPAGFVKYLMDWILNHVANMDKKYSPYLSKLKQI